MYRNLIFLLILFSSFGFAQQQYRVAIQPLDFQQSKDENFFMANIGQIETDGPLVYLRSIRELEVSVMTPEGHLARRFGGNGGFSSEFGVNGVLAISVRDGVCLAIDAEQRLVRRFEEGRFQFAFRLHAYNVFATMPSSNSFAFSNQHIVIPTAPATGHLASVYGHDGVFRKFAGSLIPFDEDLMQIIPGINDTYWLFQGDQFYSIHKFYPIISTYDTAFERTNQFHLSTPAIEAYLEVFLSFTPLEPGSVPGPLFTDAKIYGGQLYLMSQGVLHQISLEDGTLESQTRFFGTGKDFAHLEDPHVNLYFFAFLPDGRLVLGHPAMLWNHDLWTAQLPFSRSGS
jgi:hypothetical protein